MSFYHNSKGVSPDANFPLAEEGWYPLKIVEAEELESKNGNEMIRLTAKIINDQRYPNVEVRHYVVFLPAENKGAGISVQFRRSIGVPFGGNDLVDAATWVGKRFMGYLVQETYEGVVRNKITKVSPEREAPPKPLEEPDAPPEMVENEPSPVERIRRKAVGISAGADSDIEF